MSDSLRVTVASISRFHSFELARQLHERNVLAAVYTGLARRFVRRYGIGGNRLRSFPWVQTPLEAAQRLNLLAPQATRRIARLAHRALDRHIARTLPDCHAYIALSGIGVESGRMAQHRNVAYVCDRSSAHIVVQDRILAAEYAALGLTYTPIDPVTVERELTEYEQADVVVVPSRFAYESFLREGHPAERLRRVALGVDLSRFAPGGPRDDRFRVLFVGQPGVRKGLHYLLRGVRQAGIVGARLAIVGARDAETDILLKRYPVEGLDFIGPLSQAKVAAQMSRAAVLVLPSVEDGFGLVILEAMACGCPVIVSDSAGGADFVTNGREGFIVPAGDSAAIADRLVRLAEDQDLRAEMAQHALERVRSIGGWTSYGDEICTLFQQLAAARGHDVVLPEDDR